MLQAEIYITLKKTVADPQGLTIKHALHSLGYQEVDEARIGKLIIVRLNLKNKQEAEKKIKQMCQKLLANPIIEEYSYKISEAQTYGA